MFTGEGRTRMVAEWISAQVRRWKLHQRAVTSLPSSSLKHFWANSPVQENSFSGEMQAPLKQRPKGLGLSLPTTQLFLNSPQNLNFIHKKDATVLWHRKMASKISEEHSDMLANLSKQTVCFIFFNKQNNFLLSWVIYSGSVIKNSPAMQEPQETRVRSLDPADPSEKGIATRSSILAWRTPWTRSLAGYSPWGHKESDTTEVTEHIHKQYRKHC